jgi:hypothetical protein
MTDTQKVPWKRISIEAAAIVGSILLAFAIDAWWQERGEQEDLLQYLSAFEQELIESRKDIELALELSTGVLKTTDEVFLVLSDSERNSLPSDFAETIGSIYKIHSPNLNTGAYEDMVSSGNMRLIGNRTLSDRIKQYMQSVSSVRSVNEVLWDTYYNLQVPYLKDHFVISDFGWESAEEIDDAAGLLSITPKGPYSIDLDAVKSQEYWNLLYSWKEAYSDQVRRLVVAREDCDAVLESLQPEVESLRDGNRSDQDS